MLIRRGGGQRHCRIRSHEPFHCIEGESNIAVVGNARIVPRSTREATAVPELHVWHVNDGQLLALDVVLNAPASLLATFGA